MKLYSLLLLATFAVTAAAQQTSDLPVYQVQFKIREHSDAASKARVYTLLMNIDSKGVFRAGNKIPYLTSSAPGQTGQYNFADVGVNIEARLLTVNGGISLNADLDVGSVVQRDNPQASSLPNPTISSVRVSVNAHITPGKPAAIASIDDPVTSRKFDIEATVTRAN